MHCFKACLRCRKNVGRAVDNICQPLMGHTVRFSNTADSQIAHKIPDFQYPLSTDNGMLHYKERHPLVMKYSKTSFRFVQYMAWAFLCIFLSLMGPMKTFPTKVDPQNAHKMPNCKYPLSTENEILFHNERHPLLMKCFQIFLICMRQLGGAYLCILLPLMCLTELCSTKVDP